MFWRKFGKRTSEDPEQTKREQLARTELEDRIVALLSADKDSVYTIRHLEQKLSPVSIAALSLALAELQEAKLVDRIVRVESPESHGGIKDFASPSELPDEIKDWRTNRMVPVTPENTAFLFKAHRANELVPSNA